MPTKSSGGATTSTGSSAKLQPDKPTTRSNSSKTKTSTRSNVYPASPLTSVPSPIPPTQKRKLPSTDAGPFPKMSSPGLGHICYLGDLLRARGVGGSVLAIADSRVSTRLVLMAPALLATPLTPEDLKRERKNEC